MTRILQDRFWSKVDRHGDGCWLWKAHRDRDGYGQFGYDRRIVYAHRMAWKLVNGEIPAGLWTLHRCDNPPCVNPAHLFLGTNADNQLDFVAKGLDGHKRAVTRRMWKNPKISAKIRAAASASNRGIGHPSAKLSESDVRAIRDACGTTREIAACFGVSQSTACTIRNGKKWGHLV